MASGPLAAQAQEYADRLNRGAGDFPNLLASIRQGNYDPVLDELRNAIETRSPQALEDAALRELDEMVSVLRDEKARGVGAARLASLGGDCQVKLRSLRKDPNLRVRMRANEAYAMVLTLSLGVTEEVAMRNLLSSGTEPKSEFPTSVVWNQSQIALAKVREIAGWSTSEEIEAEGHDDDEDLQDADTLDNLIIWARSVIA